jgi:1,4-dihydroxy-2-naphthoyl-CoA hydrolase
MTISETSIEKLNAFCQNSLVSQLGIEITQIDHQTVSGKMPVDARTQQPLGFLHGGASLAFAETLASIGAILAIDSELYDCVGLEINANHLKAVTKGWVYGTAKAVHVGKTTQVWTVEIANENKELVCISRLTVAVLAKK